MEKSPERCAIGIDFGGTVVKMARVDEHGGIGARASFATAGLDGVDGWLDEVERHVAELLKDLPAGQEWRGIGVGVPGLVNYAKGFIYDLTNVPGWTAVPLADTMSMPLPWPMTS